MQKLKQIAKAATVFGLLGPIIGHVAFIIFMCALQILTPTGDSLDDKLTMWGLLLALAGGGLYFSYVVGFVPATVTGLLYSVILLLYPRLMTALRIYRAGIAAVIGAASILVFYAYVGIGARWNSGFAIAPYGIIAAFIVGYFWPSKPTEAPSNHSFNGDIAKATRR